MEDKKSSRIGFINHGDTGMWGNLTWGDNHYLIRNVAPMADGKLAGDIQIETGNTYLNKAGKECKEYKKIGALRFSKDSGMLVIEENGKINKYAFTPTPQKNDRGEYLLLSFGEENPYMKYLDDEPEVTPEPLDVSSIPDSVPF